MTELVKQSLYWRLSGQSGEGLQQVSMVLPVDFDDEFLVPTDVIYHDHFKFNTQTNSASAADSDLQWSEEDVSLFASLVRSMLEVDNDEETATLNLSDEGVVSIVQIVAAARFAKPTPVDDLVIEIPNTIKTEYDIGELAAISTTDGYKSVVVVDMDSVDAVCILLDDFYHEETDTYIAPFESLRINKHCLLVGEFADEVMATEEITVH